MKKLALIALILSACVAGPDTAQVQQGFAQPDVDPIPTCGGVPCDNPRCADLGSACTVHAEYPDDVGCHVVTTGTPVPNGDTIQCLCTGVLSEDTRCTLSGFSS